jgi:hypothetical protein
MRKINHFGFNTKNYWILVSGLGINILGFILMIGGGTDDPNSFDADALFSPIRITLAPFLILLGYVVVFISIMKKPIAKVQDISEKAAKEEQNKPIPKSQKRK